VEIDYVVIPGTNNSFTRPDAVVDVVVGQGFIVYLDKSGRLFSVRSGSPSDITSHAPQELKDFTNRLAADDPQAQFTSLSGQFHSFAVVSDRGNVYVGHHNEKTNTFELKVYEALQHVGCISVAVGDYHYLALLKGGRVLTWGTESEECGCFGLGNRASILNEHPSARGRKGLLKWSTTLDEPTPVPVEGHVVAIAAAGWHSAAVVVSRDEQAPGEIHSTQASCPVGSVADLQAKINSGQI
jgi:SCF-associated factor 1